MLTTRQQEIWQFLAEYVDAHGYPPTVREIGDAVGLASPSTVHAHLANLERAGLLRRDPTKPRAIELVGPSPRGGAAQRRVDTDPSSRRSYRGRRSAARGGGDRGRDRRPRAARPRRRLPPPRHGRLDDRGRHPRRRHRRRPQAGRRPRRARSSSLSSATTRPPTRRRSRPSTASATAASASSRRTPRSSRSSPSTSRSSAR